TKIVGGKETDAVQKRHFTGLITTDISLVCYSERCVLLQSLRLNYGCGVTDMRPVTTTKHMGRCARAIKFLGRQVDTVLCIGEILVAIIFLSEFFHPEPVETRGLHR